MTGLRVVLAADESVGLRTMTLLERSPHIVAAVAARRGSALAARAERLDVAVFDAGCLGRDETADEIAALSPDVLLNVHSLTKVCARVLDVFPIGAWNLHPGPLPEAAGINVPSWAIALGWRQHGVTIHRMTAEYDDGDIAYQERFPIGDRATGLTLSAECGIRGLRLVGELIDQLATDPTAVPNARQDLTRRSFYGRGQPADGVIDWSQPAATIEAHVRAADFRPYSGPWRAPRALVDGEWVELIEVIVGPAVGTSPGAVRCSDGVLEVAAADRWITLRDTRKAAAP